MCDSTGDACWELPLCVFSMSAHIKMLTRITNLQVCEQDKQGGGEKGRGGVVC